jgi:hypothetical protein
MSEAMNALFVLNSMDRSFLAISHAAEKTLSMRSHHVSVLRGILGAINTAARLIARKGTTHHNRDIVGDLESFVQLVSNKHERGAILLQLAEHRGQRLRSSFIETRVWLVCKEQDWRIHDRPRNRNTLLHAAAQHAHRSIHLLKSHSLERNASRFVRITHSIKARRELHVFQRSKCGIQHGSM